MDVTRPDGLCKKCLNNENNTLLLLFNLLNDTFLFLFDEDFFLFVINGLIFCVGDGWLESIVLIVETVVSLSII